MTDDAKPSLQALSHALRHPETWPAGFEWDFNNCDTCAMELAHRLWDDIPETLRNDGALVMARNFQMPYRDAANIFMGDGDWVPSVGTGSGRMVADLDAVTPAMVADQIDAYLARQE